MYKIYYHIPSRWKYRSVHSAKPKNTLEDLIKLVPKLKRIHKDVIFIYDIKYKTRGSIVLSDTDGYDYRVVLELTNSNYERHITKSDLAEVVESFEQICEDPQRHDFLVLRE